ALHAGDTSLLRWGIRPTPRTWLRHVSSAARLASILRSNSWRAALAIGLCAMLLSSAAFAQSKGGPNPDPLGDHQHADKSSKNDLDDDYYYEPGGAKVVVKKRVVRVTKTRTVAPTAKKATPPAPAKQSATKPKKAAPRASTPSSPPAR